MVDPEAFDIKYVINPHMAAHLNGIDRHRARDQWEQLRQTFVDLGLQVTVHPSVPGLPDLCFAANQTFPLRDTRQRVLRSKMAAPQRRPEVDLISNHWLHRGATVIDLETSGPFEAGGDGLWYPGKRLILAGVGSRSTREAWMEVSRVGEVPVILFDLVSPRFYHLDTCLCPLDDRCALFVPEAFSDAGLQEIHRLFPEAAPIPNSEAQQLAGNATVLRNHFLVQAGSHESASIAASRGLEVIQLDTSEFIKSGGSITCLHLRF